MLFYDKNYASEIIDGENANYTTTYCVCNEKEEFLFEFELTHNYTLKQVSLTLYSVSSDGWDSSCSSQKKVTGLDVLFYAVNNYLTLTDDGIYWYFQYDKGIRVKYVSEKKQHFNLLEYDNGIGLNFDFTE